MIEDIIRDLRALTNLDAEIAKAAAPRLEAIAKSSAASGTTPDGKAWKPRKKDGARPLANAADRVHAVASGNLVTLVVDGPEFYHQTAKPDASLPQRKIIPSVGDPIPAAMRAELAAVTSETIARLTRGAA